MSSLKFSKYQILLKSKKPGKQIIFLEKDDFQNNQKEIVVSKEYQYHKIRIDITDNSIWIYQESGSPMPHREKIVNIKDNTEKDNSRTEDEVELNKQFFFFYSFNNYCLYLSDNKKKNFYTSLFKENFNMEIEIKDIYKNINDFIESLSSVSEISFTCESDLFSTDASARNSLIDLTGCSAPERFTIKTHYKDKYYKPISFIKKMNREKENNKLSSLIVRGHSKNTNIDLIYNTDTLRESIPITANKNDEGIYNEEEVINELTKAICGV